MEEEEKIKEVLDKTEILRYPDDLISTEKATTLHYYVLADPYYLEVFDEEGREIAEEGCLSIPERNGLVARPEKIKLTAYNRYGEKYERGFLDLAARVILHEIDHLDGVLFIDKMIDPAELAGMEG